MNHIDLLQKLPNSIYDTTENSQIYKLWKLFGLQQNELEEVFNDLALLLDYDEQSGVVLDLIGKILREKRNGKSDNEYRQYLYIAVQKLLSDGSVENLNSVTEAIFEDKFLCIRNLYPSQKTNPWADDAEYQLYLDGSWYLEGMYFLSADVFQPAFFEIRIKKGVSQTLMQLFETLIVSIKGSSIGFRIIEED